MADPSRSPVAVRVIRPYATEEEFLAREPETLTRTTVILLGAQPKPQGVILRFELALASGDPLLRGEGRVTAFKAATAGGDSTLTLRFTRLDARSKALVDRAAALRDAKTRGNAPPSNPDLSDSSPALAPEPTIVSRPQARPASRRPAPSSSRPTPSARGPASAGPVTQQEPPPPPPSVRTDEVPAVPLSSSTMQVAAVHDPDPDGVPQAEAGPAPVDSTPTPEPSIPLLEPSVPVLEATGSNPDLTAIVSAPEAIEAPPSSRTSAAEPVAPPPASGPTLANASAARQRADLPRSSAPLPAPTDRDALLTRLRERARALPSETVAAILAPRAR